MNFEFSDDQQAIKRTAHEFLEARYRSEQVRELAADERGFTDEQWRALAELGWPALMIDEGYDGLGLGAVELVVIMEEIGYALAPTPLLSTIAAGLLIAAIGTDAQRQRWLPGIASGELRGAVAVIEPQGGWDPDHSELELAAGTLSATKVAVADAGSADVLVVAGADGVHFLVERSAPGLTVTPQRSLDPTRKLYEVAMASTPAEAMVTGERAARSRAYAIVAAALAAENVGIAQRTMEMAVAYAQDRKQFDRPIGSYQAIAHRCAQMLLETEGARSLTYGAGWALDHDPTSALRAASMAKAYAGDAGYRVAASALQVHGGIGFTWEHDLHFFLKRARANAHAYGDSRWHRERVVALAGV